jgi:hypothetical protein
VAGIHAANVLLYLLGLRACGLHDSRRGNHSRHGRELTRIAEETSRDANSADFITGRESRIVFAGWTLQPNLIRSYG